jgi:hypothetical protein
LDFVMKIALAMTPLLLSTALFAQFPGFPDFGGRGPGGGRGGFGGPGGQNAPNRKLVDQFDKDGDGMLNAAERKAAREFLAKENTSGGGRFGGFGGRGGFPGPMGGGNSASAEAIKPGPKLTAAGVKSYPTEPLYDLGVLRTLFLDFEDADWEQEAMDFYKSDVDVPAKLTVDGKVYPGVGIHFRGMTSYMMVGKGRKHSIHLSINFTDPDLRLNGYRSFILLNSSQDPTYLRTILYHYVARQYIPAPKANLIRVVINGESWGAYVNTQHFDADFIRDNYKTTKGARWKVLGGPGGRGGLAYHGDSADSYKQSYEIKTKDDPKSWADLIKLCKTLNQTPADQLEKALAPMLDIDGALRFLAVDKVLINNDGYWTRASDYSLYEDPDGRFHVIPWDANETFGEAEMMGMFGGPGRGGRGGNSSSQEAISGVKLPPMTGSEDSEKALLYSLLKVPSLRAKYLSYIRDISEKWLDWNKIGPVARQLQALVADDMKTDNRKLDSTEDFTNGLTKDRAETAGRGGAGGGFGPPPEGFGGPDGGFGPPPGMFGNGRGGPGGRGPGGPGGPGGGSNLSIKSFVEQRRAYLLSLDEVKNAARL